MEEELVREVLASLLVLADNKYSRSVFIDSMHQAGTLVALLEHRVILQVEGEGIDKRSAVVAVSRVYAHSSLLIHYDNIIVLVHNVDWNILRRECNLLARKCQTHRDMVERF